MAQLRKFVATYNLVQLVCLICELLVSFKVTAGRISTEKEVQLPDEYPLCSYEAFELIRGQTFWSTGGT